MTKVKELLEQESIETQRTTNEYEKQIEQILNDDTKNYKDKILLILSSNMLKNIADNDKTNKLDTIRKKLMSDIQAINYKNNEDFKLGLIATGLRFIADMIDEYRGKKYG